MNYQHNPVFVNVVNNDDEMYLKLRQKDDINHCLIDLVLPPPTHHRRRFASLPHCSFYLLHTLHIHPHHPSPLLPSPPTRDAAGSMPSDDHVIGRRRGTQANNGRQASMSEECKNELRAGRVGAGDRWVGVGDIWVAIGRMGNECAARIWDKTRMSERQRTSEGRRDGTGEWERAGERQDDKVGEETRGRQWARGGDYEDGRGGG
ncbi:hypothetical protein BDN70DRAFT_898554 [Pholiota conissans]|uniref:Uncharacterized protein n=1 Tax=Pholiota conissans TaxID=109636 RepID=A0A9P5YW42_9AGAR|nr:hypothetical protein BDN70DRAFT_898554 [Pholiota conissans]